LDIKPLGNYFLVVNMELTFSSFYRDLLFILPQKREQKGIIFLSKEY
jgi:hypothetical protein